MLFRMESKIQHTGNPQDVATNPFVMMIMTFMIFRLASMLIIFSILLSRNLLIILNMVSMCYHFK